MKYETTIIVPPCQAGSSRAKIALQMLPVAVAKDYETDEEAGKVVFKFESTFKNYLRVFAFFSQFNVTMKKQYETRKMKYLAGTHYAEMKKYYDMPAMVEITEPPTADELTEEEKGLFEKAKDWIKKKT